MTELLKQVFAKAISYPEYMKNMEELVAQGKTSGANQSDELVNYTKLNLKRMRRIEKTVNPSVKTLEAAKSIPFETNWIIIGEAWCGDVAQNLPFIAALADKTPRASLKIIYRDENPAFMDLYLTNGARSIPKLIIFRADSNEELATWGPRPREVQEMVEKYKNSSGVKVPFQEFATEIHKWYAGNKNVQIEQELMLTFNEILQKQTTRT